MTDHRNPLDTEITHHYDEQSIRALHGHVAALANYVGTRVASLTIQPHDDGSTTIRCCAPGMDEAYLAAWVGVFIQAVPPDRFDDVIDKLRAEAAANPTQEPTDDQR